MGRCPRQILSEQLELTNTLAVNVTVVSQTAENRTIFVSSVRVSTDILPNHAARRADIVTLVSACESQLTVSKNIQ
jgi:hypothetical protein